MRNKGIAFKLITSILLSVIFIFFILIYYNYTKSKKIVENNIELSIDKIAESAIDSIEFKLKSVEETTRIFSFMMFDRIVPVDISKRFAQAVVESNPMIYGNEIAFEPYSYYKDSLYFGIGYSEKTGEPFFYHDYHEKDWYKKVIQSKKAFWTDPFINAATNKLVCSFCMPIFKIDGDTFEVTGAMKSNVPISWLDNVISKIEVYESGFATLISKNGTFISHPKKEYINNESLNSLADKLNMPGLKRLNNLKKTGERGHIEFKDINTGKKGILVYAPVAENNWTIAILFLEKEYYGELNVLHRNLIIIVILGAIILFLIISFISNKITKPLKELSIITKGIGAGNFNVKLPLIKSHDEVGQLNHSLQLMQNELKNYIANLKNVTVAKEKIESDVRIAGEIQQSLIPKIFPEYPNKYGLDVYGILKPAKDISGDLFDFFFIDDHFYFAIGDVAGKGVPASQFMAITRTLLRANSKKLVSPDVIVSEINNELCQGNEQEIFVTFFIGIMELESGKIQYCNAGHNYPYIIRSDSSVETINKKHGLPLGLFKEKEYKYDNLSLNKGESFILYTDGITEAENKNKELFDDKRLKDTLHLRKFSSSKVLTNTIISRVEEFVGDAEQSDDLTILVISRRD